MILSDKTLAEYLESGRITILPQVKGKDIRPLGIRVHLAPSLLVPEGSQTVDPSGHQELKFEQVSIGDDGYRLDHGQFVLASTVESVRVDRSLACFIDGRSTLARLGLTVHCTSSVFDNIHDEARTPTLEIASIGRMNVILRADMPIAMLMFATLTAPIKQASQSQYRGQSETMPPRLSFRIGDQDE